MTDEQQIQAFIAEMTAIHALGPIEVAIDATSAFGLIGLIQLAMRHPKLTDHHQETARSFIDRLSVIFPPDSLPYKFIQQGYNPEFDKVPEEVQQLMNIGKKLVDDLNESDPDHCYEIEGLL